MAAWGSSRQRHRQQHRQLLLQDDLGDTDIMAYSAMNAGGDDEDTIFSSGGAIMDALEQKAPGIKKDALSQEKSKQITKLKSSTTVKGVSKINFKVEPVVVKGNKIVSKAIGQNMLAQQAKKN